MKIRDPRVVRIQCDRKARERDADTITQWDAFGY